MRYNIYNQVHRPFKLALLSTSIKLNSGAVGRSSAASIIEEIQNLLMIYKQLEHYECTYILPLVFEYEPSTWNMITTEHQTADNLWKNLQEKIATYNRNKDDAIKEKLFAHVSAAFEHFMVLNLQHMKAEEEVLNEILWRYYSDNFLLEIERGLKVLPLLNQQTVAA